LEIKSFFQNQNNMVINRKRDWNKKFYLPGSWSPPDDKIPINVKNYIELTRILFKKRGKNQFNKPRKFHSIKELRLLKKLKNNSNIIIKPADKNMGLTILDVNWYKQEGETQLSDAKTYKLVTKNNININKLETRIKSFVNENSDYFNQQELKFLIIHLKFRYLNFI